MPEISNKTYKWGIGAVLALFSIFLFYLNILSPYMPGDDYMFMMKMPNDGSVGMTKIHSLKDFIESQVNIYFTSHYRVLVHSLIQTFLMLPAWVFDLVNTIVFLIVARLVIPQKGSIKQFPLLFLCVVLFIWIFHIDLANAYFWTTGAINYSWTLIPLLCFVRYLVKYIDEDIVDRKLLYLSPFVASSNENALIGLFAITALLVLRFYFKKRKLNIILCFSALILLIGGLIMIFAPSAAARVARDSFEFDNIWAKVIEFTKRSSFYLIRYTPILLFFFLYKKRKLSLKRSSYWLLAIIVLSLYLALSLLNGSKNISNIFLTILLIVSTALAFSRFKIFKSTHLHVKTNIEVLKSVKGKNAVQLDKQCLAPDNKSIVCYEIDERQSYINKSLANYFGLTQVTLKDKYSRRFNLKQLMLTIDNGGLDEYNKTNEGIYVKESNEGTHLVLDLGEERYTDDITTIVRGKRKGSIKQRLTQILPKHIQLYMLDFLEYTGDYYEDGKSVLIKSDSGKTYAYHLIYQPQNYEFYFWCTYSLNNHTHIGEIKKLVLK